MKLRLHVCSYGRAWRYEILHSAIQNSRCGVLDIPGLNAYWRFRMDASISWAFIKHSHNRKHSNTTKVSENRQSTIGFLTSFSFVKFRIKHPVFR